MKKFFKILLITILSLITLVIGSYLVMTIPVKKAVHIDTVEGKPEELTKEDTKILVRYDSGTDGGWYIEGKGNILFKGGKPEDYPYMALEGNYPNYLNPDLLSYNTFVFEGHYEGKEDGKFKVFKVDKWNFLYPIKWGEHEKDGDSKDSVNLQDICSFGNTIEVSNK